ncbi:MAG TPA: alpha-2-macroglobulin family protein [Candidatus Limnocylindrales bacterium]|nr:alpha-2-macroglobulin family protein [Candidatus Limnocylindrales bacterium]
MRWILKSKFIVFLLIAFLGASLLQLRQSAVKTNILGSDYRTPQIYISGGDNGYSSGGVISLSTIDEPTIEIGSYNVSGKAEILLYQSNEDAMLDYLTHDKNGKQMKTKPDTGKIRYITTIQKEFPGGNTDALKVNLPLSGKGIWYINVKSGSKNTDAFIIRSGIGAVVREGDGEYIFWGQNFKTKRSLQEGAVILYSLQDGRREMDRVSFGKDGIAKAQISGDADIALIAQDDERAIMPINLRYMYEGSSSYRYFQEKVKKTRYFIFTDRPLYKPGDTVSYKAILRDDDDARYSIPTGEAQVKLYSGYYYEGSEEESIYEEKKTISPDGAISGTYKIPTDSKVGNHTLAVSLPERGSTANSFFYRGGDYSASTISFDVQYYKKPEFSIEVSSPKIELISKDKTTFKIKGSYFSGQPLLGQKIKYIVSSSDYYEYEYLSDQKSRAQNVSDKYRYGNWYGGNHNVANDTAVLNKHGEAEIDLKTDISFAQGKTQILSIEATIDDGSLTPAFSRKNILVYAGEYGIYRRDSDYGKKINTPLNLPVALRSHKGKIDVAGIDLYAKVHREDWISYQEENKKYPSYRKEEENLPDLRTKTDENGNAEFSFTPTKTGSYKITVEGKDARGNSIAKEFYSYVSSDDRPYYNQQGQNDLTIEKDKSRYQPTDSVKLNIFSQVPNRDVLLSFERGRVDRYQVVSLFGKSGSVDIPLTETDIPNMYASVVSFDDNTLNQNQINIPVSTESKKLITTIKPDSNTFGPGETVTLDIKTADTKGNPVSSDVAIRVVDKAIFELTDSNVSDIFDNFWLERSNGTQEAHSLQGIIVSQGGGGGCFVAGTQILMSDKSLKSIEKVKAGDWILTRSNASNHELVKAKVASTHKAEEPGFLIINSTLKVTANHKLFSNGEWKEAGSVQPGDYMYDADSAPVRISSIEWQRQKATVYNLEIEKYHTFFAGGFWVHNQKGMTRQSFKDTAYWNPSVQTDSSGTAKITFKLPDNLTTWVIAAVAASKDTQVGQTSDEIVVTKDVIIRPILPNILRTGDLITFSALAQNFTDSKHDFDIGLKFDSGEVSEPDKPGIGINSQDIQQLYWNTKVTREKEKAKLTFSIDSKTDKKLKDVVIQEIPVQAFGFEESAASVGVGNKNYSIKLSKDSDKDKSKVTLSLSPTLLGALPSAMKYLINYPYGCVEQTTSRFAPAVIAKANPELFPESFSDKKLDEVIRRGVNKLTSQQNGGGWSWWYSGRQDPFVTSYVVEYLLEAKKAGAKVDATVLDGAKNYLSQAKDYDQSRGGEVEFDMYTKIAKNYGLTLLGAKDKLLRLDPGLENISPDFLSLAVMTNYLNGDTDPKTNGLEILESMAKTQGNGVYWEAGSKINFGSRDASTAMAVRAITLAGGNRDLATRAVGYLTRGRQSNYWSNTYATSQVIRAISEFSKIGRESTPVYSYSVLLDGTAISQGSVGGNTQSIKDIEITVEKIKPSGSTLSIAKKGEGNIYSTLLIIEFRTDRKAKALNHGLFVKREYVREKGDEYRLGVGDTAIVKITVGGLSANENYGAIRDELPSGLVPINEEFKNEQYNVSNSYADVAGREITENGAIISLYNIAPGEKTYSYRARVVNEGTFIAPPATAGLMYAPEIYGRSSVQTLTIADKSQLIPQKAIKKTIVKIANNKYIPSIIFAIVAGIVMLIILRKKEYSVLLNVKERIQKLIKKDNQPPASGE